MDMGMMVHIWLFMVIKLLSNPIPNIILLLILILMAMRVVLWMWKTKRKVWVLVVVFISPHIAE